jgi:hypothetical protein
MEFHQHVLATVFHYFRECIAHNHPERTILVQRRLLGTVYLLQVIVIGEINESQDVVACEFVGESEGLSLAIVLLVEKEFRVFDVVYS